MEYFDRTAITPRKAFRHAVNGVVMSHGIDREKGKAVATGRIALQIHPGPPMKVQFKNIRLKIHKCSRGVTESDRRYSEEKESRSGKNTVRGLTTRARAVNRCRNEHEPSPNPTGLSLEQERMLFRGTPERLSPQGRTAVGRGFIS